MLKEILVIDDNPDIRLLVSNILKDKNYSVRTAANYDQAEFEINKKLPDLAIIDIKLDKPDKDGIDLLKIIKNSLCYSYAMFVEPKEPKNPYTNINFSIHNLYNIYFITKNIDITFPVLLNIYFKSNFDLFD